MRTSKYMSDQRSFRVALLLVATIFVGDACSVLFEDIDEDPNVTECQLNEFGAYDPTVKHSWAGTNGKFEDECDAEGNLIAHFCEPAECGANQDPECRSQLSGAVVSQMVNCDGRCQEGTCEAYCPQIGDAVVYVTVDGSGNVVLDSNNDDRNYACTLIADNPNDSVNCTLDPVPQAAGAIVSLGLSQSSCTGGSIGNLGVRLDDAQATGSQHCSYRCTFLYN